MVPAAQVGTDHRVGRRRAHPVCAHDVAGAVQVDVVVLPVHVECDCRKADLIDEAGVIFPDLPEDPLGRGLRRDQAAQRVVAVRNRIVDLRPRQAQSIGVALRQGDTIGLLRLLLDQIAQPDHPGVEVVQPVDQRPAVELVAVRVEL